MIRSVIKPRLDAAGADISNIAIPRKIPLRRGKAPDMLLLPDSARRIAGMIRETDAKLLIIDPITAFLDPHVNSNNDASVRSAISPLTAELDETGCSSVMIRHFNKNASLDAKSRGGGSVAFGAIARVQLVAARLPNSYIGTAHFGLSQADTNMTKLIDGTLTYDIVDSDIEMDDQGNMVPRLEWRGVTDMDADTLVRGDVTRHGPDPVVQDEIADVLRQLFDEKDTWDYKRVLSELASAGVSVNAKTISKAKLKLGITSKQVRRPDGFLDKWVWTTAPDKLSVPVRRRRQ
jgi:hypothetical protein